MKKIVVVFLATFGLISFANAGEAPEPCGPAGQLSEDFSKNVGSDARCFELRMYTAEPAVDGKGGIDDYIRDFGKRKLLFSKNMVRR